ncbi:CdaR family protein [Atopobacter phocae]|uniref:CdaR family protein n=1 Tax=Atopobacter phocae TaxID=136492 RepID=UPI000470ADE3|nr:CdaR family protein [Atopobacter phocae]
MSKWLNNRFVTAGISLLLTILLFSYVQSINLSNRQSQSISIQAEQTVDKIPVSAKISENDFVVSGLPTEVSVSLQGPSSAVRIASSNRNFKVVTPNLDELGVGTHEITLTTEGLPAELSGIVVPRKVTIQIERLITREYPIEIVNEDGVGIQNNVEFREKTAKVRGSESTIQAIQSIRGVFKMSRQSPASQQVELNAFDREGQTLSVNIEPQSINVIRKEDTFLEKTVPIIINSTNEQEGFAYSYIAEPAEIQISGDKKVLSNIYEVSVQIDVATVKDNETVYARLHLPSGVFADVYDKVEVKVRKKKISGNTSETESDSEDNQNVKPNETNEEKVEKEKDESLN